MSAKNLKDALDLPYLEFLEATRRSIVDDIAACDKPNANLYGELLDVTDRIEAEKKKKPNKKSSALEKARAKRDRKC